MLLLQWEGITERCLWPIVDKCIISINYLAKLYIAASLKTQFTSYDVYISSQF